MTRRKWMGLAPALVAALLVAPAARAEFDPEAWRSVRDVKVTEGAEGEHARLALDEHVWDHAAGPRLHDLRLIRGEAEEIGYAIYVPRKVGPRIEERPARVFNIAKRSNKATELSLDLGENPPITNRVGIETPDKDFGCAVVVEGSDSGRRWKTIRDDAAIFDFVGYERGRFTTVSFPDSRYRYLRLVVSAPPGRKPIDLSGATVFQEIPAEEPELPMLVDRPVRERTETQKERETWFTLDLAARHLPVGKILLETADENFAREVRLSVSDDRKRWRSAGGGFIFRYRTARYRAESLAVEFGEQFGRYLRIRVLNGDDPPLAVMRITVQGRPRYLFFPFEPGRRFRLFYENRDAHKAEYDYGKVFERIARRSAIEARLGGVQHNPRFIATRQAPPPHPWIRRNQWVLYVALGVAVIGLSAVALRVLRQNRAVGES